ncbi:MAG: helix-turn-helix domain-containing protein, partial [Patescibacteria group bacterium]
ELRVDEAVEIKTKTGLVKNSDPVLFEQLRRLRKELADQRNVPAFVIFGDRTLHELAAYQPRTVSEMAGIFGVGDKKLKDFGEAFVAVIQCYEPNIEALKEPKPSTVEETFVLWNEGLSIDDIAARRVLKPSTIVSHLEQLVASGEKLDLARINIAPDRIAAIRNAFANSGDSKLGPVRSQLGDDYSWDELRLARLLLNA